MQVGIGAFGGATPTATTAPVAPAIAVVLLVVAGATTPPTLELFFVVVLHLTLRLEVGHLGVILEVGLRFCW